MYVGFFNFPLFQNGGRYVGLTTFGVKIMWTSSQDIAREVINLIKNFNEMKKDLKL